MRRTHFLGLPLTSDLAWANASVIFLSAIECMTSLMPSRPPQRPMNPPSRMDWRIAHSAWACTIFPASIASVMACLAPYACALLGSGFLPRLHHPSHIRYTA